MATTDGSASGFPLEEVRRSAQAMVADAARRRREHLD